MRATIQRDTFTNEATLGKLYVNSVYKCYTKEDCSRHLSSNCTALPPGEYAMITEYSDLYQTRVIKIIGVKNGIFHPLNSRTQSKTTIKLGHVRYRNNVAEDRALFDFLYDLVRDSEVNDEYAILTICN